MSRYERHQWLARTTEAALDPTRQILDAHHHLWRRNDSRYLAEELLADTTAAHNVTHTVFVECASAYDIQAPSSHAPVGETRFVVDEANRLAERCETQLAAIVGHADLLLGRAVEPVLAAHVEAGRGRFRGIRHGVNWSRHAQVKNGHHDPEPNQLANPQFRAGLAALADRNLTFDAWLYFDQLDELAAAARAVPGVTIVLNHLGGPLGIGPYAGAGRLEMLEVWQQGIVNVASCDNVVCKVGGLGMEHYFGMGWSALPSPPSSSVVATWWSEIVHRTIEAFGPDRCMFESNFPVDRQTLPYTVLWNAFERLADRYDPAEQHSLFFETAARAYRIAGAA